jgi:hypothetical protein
MKHLMTLVAILFTPVSAWAVISECPPFCGGGGIGTPVPEPEILGLLAVGAVIVFASTLKKRKK